MKSTNIILISLVFFQKSILDRDAEELIKHFEKDLKNLNNSKDKRIEINIIKSPPKVAFQSSSIHESDTSVCTLRDEVLTWLHDSEEVITTQISNKTKQKGIRDGLELFKDVIKYHEKEVGDDLCFYLRGRKRHVENYKKMFNESIDKDDTQLQANCSSACDSSSEAMSEDAEKAKDNKPLQESRKTVGNITKEIDSNDDKIQPERNKLEKKDVLLKSNEKLKEKEKAAMKTDEPLVHIPGVDTQCTFDVTLREGIILKAYIANITMLQVDCIVNPANENLKNEGGCAYHISQAAGKEFDDDCRKVTKKIPITKNVITCPGKLPCKCVIHAVGPIWDDGYTAKEKEKCLEELMKTVYNVLQTADEKKMCSIAIPPISSGIEMIDNAHYCSTHLLIFNKCNLSIRKLTSFFKLGIFGVPLTLCAPMYVKAITDFGTQKKKRLREIHIVDIDPQRGLPNLIDESYHIFLKEPRSLNPKSVFQRNSHQTGSPTALKPTKRLSANSEFKKVNSVDFDKVQGRQPVCTYIGSNVSGKHEFEMDKKLKVYIYKQNIVSLKNIGSLVCSENSAFSGTGGLSKNIYQYASKEFCKEFDICRANLQRDGKHLQAGELRIMIPGGKLSYNNIVFTVVNRFDPNKLPCKSDLVVLEETCLKVLNRVNELSCDRKGKKTSHLKSLAMPLLGAGKYIYISRLIIGTIFCKDIHYLWKCIKISDLCCIYLCIFLKGIRIALLFIK